MNKSPTSDELQYLKWTETQKGYEEYVDADVKTKNNKV